MLQVHHLGISQSDRIVWLCEELAVPYELVHHERDPQTRLAPASYKALHPYGTAPVIRDGAVTLGESGAIVEYIIQRHGGGRLALAPSHADYAEYLYWLHFANGTFMAAAMVTFAVNQLGGPAGNVIVTSLAGRTDRAYDLVEQRLGKAPYFAGAEFTAADILMLFPLTTMRAFQPRDLAPYPNIRAYLQRIAARPAFQRAMQKADPGFQLPMA